MHVDTIACYRYFGIKAVLRPMRCLTRPHHWHSKLWSVVSLGVCLGLAACGASTRSLTVNALATPIATVPYVAPTLVPVQGTPTPPKRTPTPQPTPPLAPPTAVPTATDIPGPRPTNGVPNIQGQLILVDLSQQWMWVYQDRHLLFTTPITSGMPQLPTPTGIYHVLSEFDNIIFYSGWPPGSPYYYPPSHVNHAFYFLDVGYYLHDAPWRHYYGPGTNYPHTNPDGSKESGSHGCVEMTPDASGWLADHIRLGATIDITGYTPQPAATPTVVPTLIPPTATSIPPTVTPTATATVTPTH